LAVSKQSLQLLYMPLFQEHTIIPVWSNHPVFSENKAEPAEVVYVQDVLGEFDQFRIPCDVILTKSNEASGA
jgi:hypothetical protein